MWTFYGSYARRNGGKTAASSVFDVSLWTVGADRFFMGADDEEDRALLIEYSSPGAFSLTPVVLSGFSVE